MASNEHFAPAALDLAVGHRTPVTNRASAVSGALGQLFSQTIGVSGVTMLVKVAGALKAALIARFFGLRSDLDAYLIAFVVPSFLSDVLAGALTPTLIPVLVEARHNGGGAKAVDVYSHALYRSVLLLAMAAGALMVCAVLAGEVIPHSATTDLRLVRSLLLIMLPILPLSALCNAWRSVLHSEQHFLLAAASPLATPLVTAAFLLLIANRWGVYALAAGTVAGVGIEAVILAGAVRRTVYPVFPNPYLRAEGIAPLGRQYRAVAASNLVTQGSVLVDQSMAAMLGAGSISILNFGTRLIAVLLAIGPGALGTTVLPRFSSMTAAGRWNGLKRSVRRYLLLSTAAAIPITAVLIWFSEPIVRLIFQGGAFTAVDSRVVATVQAFSLVQLPLSIVLAILTRLVASLKMNQILVPLSVLTLSGNAAFDYVFMRIYGVAGIPLATAIVNAIVVTALAIVVFGRVNKAREEGR